MKSILFIIICFMHQSPVSAKTFPFFKKETTFPLHVGYLNGIKTGFNVCSYTPLNGYHQVVLSLKANHHFMRHKINSQSLEINLHDPRKLIGCGIMIRHYNGKALTVSPQFRVHILVNFFGQINIPIIRDQAYRVPFAEAGIEINLNLCSADAMFKDLH